MTATKKIGIIGNGNVGGALSRGLASARQDVRIVDNEPAQVRATAEWADIVILAVPFGAVSNVATTIAPAVEGKTIIDVTNALTEKMTLALGYTTSGAEELQKLLPSAHVVKAFNTQFAQRMDTGRLGDQRVTTFVSADNAAAKLAVLELANAIGFDAVDAGPLANARLLEPLGYLNIQLGYVLGLGTQIGLKLLRS
ncbi:MAG TPA: NAD(P)-binding domain-containing protein [Kofleriaceae bacterium]|nr:NAD(P)-binding domain-containing protein [Kofleriaceae bacterium]